MDLLIREFKTNDAKSTGEIAANTFKQILSKYGVGKSVGTLSKKFASPEGTINYEKFIQYVENKKKYA